MGLLKGDLEKVPKGFSPKQYYARIYDWHRKNQDKIFIKLSNRKKEDPYIRCYQELMGVLPQPKSVTLEDTALVCREVVGGLMEWAYHEKDEHDVKTAAYAQYVLDKFFDGFHGEKTRQSTRSSKLYAKYNMSACLERYRGQVK